MFRKIVILSALILSFVFCISAQTVKIEGRVVVQMVDGATMPLKEAIVKVGKSMPGLGYVPFKDTPKTKTDKNGKFKFNDVPVLPSDNSYILSVEVDDDSIYVETSFKINQSETDVLLTLKKRSFESFLEKGKRTLEFAASLKGFDNAINYLTKALELKPNNTEALDFLSQAYNKRGEAYSNGKDYTESIANFTKAISLNPQNALYYANRGKDYHESKKYDLAVADFSKAIEITPNADYYLVRAYSYKARNDFVNAEKDFSKAISLGQKNAEYYFVRGLFYNEQGKYDLAIADFNETIKLVPDNYLPYYWRGLSYGSSDKLDLAIADFSKSINLNPDDSESYRFRCLCYNLKNDFVSAITDCNKAIQLDSTLSENYSIRGQVYQKMNKNDLAIADFRKALSLDANNQDAKDGLIKLGATP